jgi:Response regulator containing CheY-like receiver domain and AraC-type DNA-binding domain
MIKVFLVEDEIVIREGIHRMIPWTEYGFEFAGEAGDGEIALPLIRAIKPDVLITDIKMPFMDGIALSKLIKKELPDMKIIIISGFDDFKYAQQAISLGVERYLLKPITKNNFIEVLEEIRIKFEMENQQKIYIEKFQNEIQEYEQYSRRDFFEMLVAGHVDLQKTYEMAEKLQIDILAQCYNIVLFSINNLEKGHIISDTYSEDTAKVQNSIEHVFHNHMEFVLFRNQMFSYAVLIKGEKDKIIEKTDECVKILEDIFSKGGKHVNWFVCTGKPVERLSTLHESYKDAMCAFAYRYMDSSRVLTYGDMRKEYVDEMNLNNININAMNSEVIRNFLSNALLDEVDSFVHNYFQMIGEDALCSRMFQQYVILNLHFCTVSFIQKLGFSKEDLEDDLIYVCMDNIVSKEKAAEVAKNILEKGILLREESTKSRYKSIIDIALDYMHENYMEETITLNKVACAANVSANHFSALFSQEMKQTFIEYLTELRMNKAKELLRCTDKRSGEIALDIGYKDSHYFSFLFKKTQGCTPSDYRNKRRSIS